MIFTKAFWKGAGERALKTFIETFVPLLIAALGTSLTGVLNVWTAPWLAALESASGLALGATFLSFCVSLGNAEFTAGTTTSAPKRAAAPVEASAPAKTSDPVVATSDDQVDGEVDPATLPVDDTTVVEPN